MYDVVDLVNQGEQPFDGFDAQMVHVDPVRHIHKAREEEEIQNSDYREISMSMRAEPAVEFQGNIFFAKKDTAQGRKDPKENHERDN